MFSKLFLCLNRNYEYLRMIKFNFTERDIVFDFCTNVLCVSQLSRTPLLKVDEHKLLSINALYDNANMSYWLKVYPIVPVLQVPFLRLFCSKMSMHCTMLHYAAHFLFNYLLFIYSVASLLSFLLITLDKRR